ncbi:mitochondrial genome maintenance MGM101 [Neoconidiobolus thromboides FSU 785]|nr:mitochondrial genome maintenance MGM101 [Neoconidiobolus thromboides FSU 785]
MLRKLNLLKRVQFQPLVQKSLQNTTRSLTTNLRLSYKNNDDTTSIEPEVIAFPNSKSFSSESGWNNSFEGVGSKPFDKEISDILLSPIDTKDIEIKPDGLLYLPEIKYRRILNRAFGPGGWGLVPRGPSTVSSKNISREYALICLGRFVSQARGEQAYFDKDELSMAGEGAKSNALTRCCKDIGIASELWDPAFVRKFKEENAEQVWVEHVSSKKKRILWRLKGGLIEYPFKITTY